MIMACVGRPGVLGAAAAAAAAAGYGGGGDGGGNGCDGCNGEMMLCPQRGDLRLSGPPSGQGAGARTRDRKVPADFRADSLATVPPTPPEFCSTFK
ncbi:hypothetical protein PoB_000203700 [Plakobranchus ocellatus]|uniref:Secreted protein n=1 Tax=Plakobranchus ocellatus TaxID=259542 RepID=A0AAV3Y0A6_9GAST|nr:hypothetical protein PoB_000203700 [Plakobranchus ocellatus]